jgi:alkanesulfonate monooxygenase SsuD/methylene tetrahydromethanopterin reductase-like flavin-dependent oxidoreductase (luciferase family)
LKIKLGIVTTNENHAGVSNQGLIKGILRQLSVARNYEFDGAFVGQHFLSWPIQTVQPIPLLGRMAAEAGHMNLGTGILLLPLFHPLEIAEQVATLDMITDGHFIFGTGLGYEEEEFEAFGVNRKFRGPRFEESLQIIKDLWTKEYVNFNGKYFRIENARPTSRPVQKPYPKIWIAGNNHPAIKRAGRIGDAWLANPMSTVSGLEELLKSFRMGLAEANKPYPQWLPLIREVYLEKDRDAAIQRCKPFIEDRFKVYSSKGQGEQGTAEDRLDVPFEELIKDRFILGNANDFWKELDRYKALGFNYLILEYQWIGMPDDLAVDFLHFVGNEIIPSLS